MSVPNARNKPRIGREVLYLGQAATVVGRTDNDPELGPAVQLSMTTVTHGGEYHTERFWVAVADVQLVPLTRTKTEPAPASQELVELGASWLLGQRARRLGMGRL